jgi:sugar/nucleoside kinase (ribokinase family)
MSSTTPATVIGIGNIYVETNYLGLMTGGADNLKIGKEYRAPKWETRLGGSVVNFTVQAQRLGLKVGLIGKIGQDDAGEKLLNLLKEAEISTDLIKVASETDVQTSVDTGLVFENGANIQVVAGNANQRLAYSDINLASPFFKTVNSVYLGGFLKQINLYQDYPTLLQKLTKMGIRIFLDHGRIPVDVTSDQLQALFKSLPFVEGYFPNQEELIGITGEKDLTLALEKALKLGPKFVVVKLGEAGCRVKTLEQDILIPCKVVKAVSTVGAGDAFNAGFISQYLAGIDLKAAAEFANLVAGIRVSQNRNPYLHEIQTIKKTV